jgi:hypothetical protein
MRDPSALPRRGPMIYIPPTGTQRQGRIHITGDGSELRDYDCRSCFVTITANDVTLNSCRFGPTGAVPVDMFGDSTRLNVESCIFDGERRNVDVRAMIRARNGTMHVRGCTFLDLPSDGIACMGGIIEFNTFRGAGFLTDAHADAIWIPRTIAPVIILGNTVDWRPKPGTTGVNNAVRCVPEMGAISDVQILNNTFQGGAFVLAIHGLPGGRGPPVDKVVVRENQFSDWKFGPLYPLARPRDLVWEGNRHQPSGRPVLL